jgi:hypothetical protein
MPEEVTLYRVFIATPGGLEQERRSFADTLQLYNLEEAIPRQASFLPVGWEDTLAGVGRPQTLINGDLNRCDYFVMVLWDRWGTPPGGDHAHYTSGTEEEYGLAMEYVRSPKHPLREVVVLFKRIEDAQRLRDPGEQLKKVLRFKEELETSRNLLFSTFRDVSEFEHTLRRHLAGWLRQHDLKSTSRVAREAKVPLPYTAPGLVARPDASRDSVRSCSLTINLFAGTREPIPIGTNVLFTVMNGNQETVYRNVVKASRLALDGLSFSDNFEDNYTVLASADGYAQAGFTPVRISPVHATSVDLMLVRKTALFDFRNARWGLLRENRPDFARLLASGAGDSVAAEHRYAQLMESRPAVLGCFFNLATALCQIHFPAGTPLDFMRELIWDETRMTQDRFFAWAEEGMINRVTEASLQGLFAPEPTAVFRPSGTRSWKQVQFGEANIQLTFHENDKRTIDGTTCILVEVDFDYYKDLLAHGILEIVANAVSGNLTDPRQVYVLRWMAGRHAGVPDFNPPYVLD